MMKHSRKVAAFAFFALGTMMVGTAVAQATVVGSSDRAAVNGSSVSVNGAEYDVSVDEMMTQALRAGATPAAAFAQALEDGFGQVEVLAAAVRAGIEPSKIQAAAEELGIDQEAVEQVLGTR
jgi:hypothetical protein